MRQGHAKVSFQMLRLLVSRHNGAETPLSCSNKRSKHFFSLTHQGCQMAYLRNKNAIFGICTLEGLETENVGIFSVHLGQFMTMWFILWPFGIFCCLWVYFVPFWYVLPRNIWQPCITHARYKRTSPV
jgi:hypothetical protein